MERPPLGSNQRPQDISLRQVDLVLTEGYSVWDESLMRVTGLRLYHLGYHRTWAR